MMLELHSSLFNRYCANVDVEQYVNLKHTALLKVKRAWNGCSLRVCKFLTRVFCVLLQTLTTLI